MTDRLAFCVDLALLLDGLERSGYPLNGSTGAPSLHGRIGSELPQFLATGEAPFATWRNGAYVLGSLPCALWLQGFRAGSVPDLEAAISRMRERGTWISDELVTAILAASRRR